MEWEKDIYAKNKQVNKWPFTDLVSDIKRIFPNNKLLGKKIVELGCGTGNNLLFFGEESCELAGIDFSESAINQCDTFLSEKGFKAELYCGDVTQKLPWGDGAADIVVDRGCITQIELNKVPELINEIDRILKPGGYLFSYTLFGSDCSDKRFGTEVSDETYDYFKEGYFKKVGRTSFYDSNTIFELYKKNKIIKISKITDKDCLNSSILTKYNVIIQK